MPNRNLTATERRDLFAPLIADVRARMAILAAGEGALYWALRRKLLEELTHDERSKPMKQGALKACKFKEQGGLCTECRSPDRIRAVDGYTAENNKPDLRRVR